MSLYKAVLNPYTGNLTIVRSDSAYSIKDSVDTYNNLPITGNAENDLRITRDTDKMYTWSIASESGSLSDWKDLGSVASVDWSAITNGPSSTPAEIDSAVVHKGLTNNPHNTLPNVDNTSDINKPISTDTQLALDDKSNIAIPTDTPNTYQFLLHGDGNTTNSATSGYTVTNVNDITYNETIKKFGSSAFSYSNDTQRLSISGNLFDMGSNDFTFETWIYPTSLSSSKALFGRNWTNSSNGEFRIFLNSNSIEIYHTVLGGGSNARIYSDIELFTLNTWTHIAIVRDGDTIRFFKNGIPFGTGDATNIEPIQGGTSFSIGSPSIYYANAGFLGELDEIRISTNTALHTTDFSADLPTLPYPIPNLGGVDTEGNLVNLNISYTNIQNIVTSQADGNWKKVTSIQYNPTSGDIQILYET